jgi:hypothetical protein
MALDGNLAFDQKDDGVGPYEETEDQTLGRTNLSGVQGSQLEDPATVTQSIQCQTIPEQESGGVIASADELE